MHHSALRASGIVEEGEYARELTKFYRLADEPTGTILSLQLLWLLSNVGNSIETKVLHKMNPVSIIELPFKLLSKMNALYYTDVQNIITQ